MSTCHPQALSQLAFVERYDLLEPLILPAALAEYERTRRNTACFSTEVPVSQPFLLFIILPIQKALRSCSM